MYIKTAPFSGPVKKYMESSSRVVNDIPNRADAITLYLNSKYSTPTGQNGMLQHSFGQAVFFVSSQHFIAPALN